MLRAKTSFHIFAARMAISRRAQLVIITLSMAWMTPFLACMSLVVTLALITWISPDSPPRRHPDHEKRHGWFRTH
jgi:hypothetical protein